MFISEGLDPYFIRPKMEKTPYMREKIDGEVFISRQIRHFSLYKYYDKSTFPSLYLSLACKQLCFPPRKGLNRRKERTMILI